MTLDKFTIRAQEAVQEALHVARAARQQTIEPLHLLKGILVKADDIASFLFCKLGVRPEAIAQAVDAELSHLPRVEGGEPYLSNDADRVLQQAVDTATKMGDDFVSIEPLLLALLDVGSTASRILKDAGVQRQALQAAVTELRKGSKVQSASAEDNYQALEKYARNLIEAARQGKLDPVIGRDDEIRRVLQILSRRT